MTVLFFPALYYLGWDCLSKKMHLRLHNDRTLTRCLRKQIMLLWSWCPQSPGGRPPSTLGRHTPWLRVCSLSIYNRISHAWHHALLTLPYLRRPRQLGTSHVTGQIYKTQSHNYKMPSLCQIFHSASPFDRISLLPILYSSAQKPPRYNQGNIL